MIRLGETVHFVLDDGDAYGRCRPALALTDGERPVTLAVFTRGLVDGAIYTAPNTNFVRSASYDNGCLPGSWHHGDDCQRTS